MWANVDYFTALVQAIVVVGKSYLHRFAQTYTAHCSAVSDGPRSSYDGPLDGKIFAISLQFSDIARQQCRVYIACQVEGGCVVPVPPLKLLLCQTDVKFVRILGPHLRLVYYALCLAGDSLPLERTVVFVLAVTGIISAALVVIENICVVLFNDVAHIFHAEIAYTDDV